MRAEYINPFINSVCNTFETMLSCKATRGEMTLGPHEPELYEISGIIGMSGKAVGSVVLSLSRSVALKAASTMLMMEATEMDDDVIDAVGELANMVAGGAKAQLQEYEMSISLPSVIVGSHHNVRLPSNVPPLCVPFDTPWGKVILQVGLAEVPVPV